MGAWKCPKGRPQAALERESVYLHRTCLPFLLVYPLLYTHRTCFGVNFAKICSGPKKGLKRAFFCMRNEQKRTTCGPALCETTVHLRLVAILCQRPDSSGDPWGAVRAGSAGLSEGLLARRQHSHTGSTGWFKGLLARRLTFLFKRRLFSFWLDSGLPRGCNHLGVLTTTVSSPGAPSARVRSLGGTTLGLLAHQWVYWSVGKGLVKRDSRSTGSFQARL